MKGLLLFLMLAVPGALLAQGRQELRLDVAGEIGIDRQGAVYDYTLNSIVTPELKGVIDKAVRQWKFEPVVRNGEPVYAKTGMRMTLAALPVAAGYQLRIENLRFLGTRRALRMDPPKYPMDAMKRGVGATILVAVRVDAEGKVLDASAAQSQLYGSAGNEKSESRFTTLLEKTSVDAAKRWTYLPADVAAGEAQETTLLVPIEYRLDGMAISEGWREGGSTVKPIPWLPSDQQRYDAKGLKQGESIVLGDAIRMKTNVVGTTL